MKGKGKDGTGKDRNRGKDNSRGISPSQDRKNIPCIYQFQKGGCSKGKVDRGTGKEEIQRKTELHHPNLKVRNHVSCMLRGNAIVPSVHTSMIVVQHLLRADRQRPRQQLPKGKPRPQPPRPKVPQWW